MSNFLRYIDTQIILESRMSATSDPRRSLWLKNLKSEYLKMQGKNNELTEIDIINKLCEFRENPDISSVSYDSWLQETAEFNILREFLSVNNR